MVRLLFMYCDLCEVTLNSGDQKESHEKGKIHQKRLFTRTRATELVRNGQCISRHCAVCNVTLTSDITALDHFEGRSHQKKVKAIERAKKEKKQNSNGDTRDVELRVNVQIQGNDLTLKSTHTTHLKTNCISREELLMSNSCDSIVDGINSPIEVTTEGFLEKPYCRDIDNKALSTENNGRSLCTSKAGNRSEFSMDHKESQSVYRLQSCHSPPLSPFLTDFQGHSTVNGHSYSHESPYEQSVKAAPVSSPSAINGYSFKAVGFERRRKISPGCNLGIRCADESSGISHANGFSESKEYFFKPKDSEIEHLVINVFDTRSTRSFEEVVRRIDIIVSRKDVLKAIFNLQEKGLLELVSMSPPIWRRKNGRCGIVESTFGRRTSCFVGESSESELISEGLESRDTFETTVDVRRKTSFHNSNSQMNSVKTTLNKSRSAPSLGSYFHPRGFPEEYHRKSVESDSNGCIGYTPLSPSGRESLTKRQSLISGLASSSLYEEDVNETNGNINLKPHLNPLQRSIMEVLSKNSRPITTLEIAKEIGLTTKRDVTPSLYAMEGAGLIYRVKHQPPVWSLSGRRCPGVIGSERNQDNPRRRSLNESILIGRYHNLNNNGYERQPEGLKPRSRSFNTYEGEENVVKSCGLCKISFSSKLQVDEHLQSTKHLNKIAKVTSEPYLKFCEHCKVHLNSKSQAQEHFSSGRHEQTVAKSQKAPKLIHPPLQTPSRDFNPVINTKTCPYGYQVELYSKAMTTNAVCFLPTGTGKTLVSALVLSHLLQLNPSRQVIFLVDRVLLVLQQSDYLKKELENVQIPVSANDEKLGLGRLSPGSMRNRRPVRVGAICGEMRKLEPGIPIFDHDILVVTADCYRNHLNNGTLRFEDVALIVLDEAHHCNKDHPYNVIIREYYLRENDPIGYRPKVMGLTASPAGEPTLERTVKKLQRLLSNLGGATLLTVTENIKELAEKTSQAELVCYCTEYTNSEHNLLGLLVEYATKCFNLAARLSELKDYKDIFQPSAGGLLATDDIYPILRVIDNILLFSNPERNAFNSLVHFQIICECICTLQECGEGVAFDQMTEMNESQCPHGFSWAQDQGLPCSKVKSSLDQHQAQGSFIPRGVSGIDSGVGELLELLLKIEWDKANGQQKPVALVLVKRRRTAVSLAKYLTSCVELQRLGASTTYMVGHGARATEGGMSVAKQKETITRIRQGFFQVVVATSVAEEGLDLPVCELVVQMDPPSSVTALVQIRGRARQRDAIFAAICRDEEQAKRIKDLLQREENMRLAAQFINGSRLSGRY